MSKIDDGGPAFPVSTRMGDDAPYGHQDSPSTWQFPGMTIRDYFAGKAMQGMFANPNIVKSNCLFNEGNFKEAWAAADAMLKAREAKP